MDARPARWTDRPTSYGGTGPTAEADEGHAEQEGVALDQEAHAGADAGHAGDDGRHASQRCQSLLRVGGDKNPTGGKDDRNEDCAPLPNPPDRGRRRSWRIPLLRGSRLTRCGPAVLVEEAASDVAPAHLSSRRVLPDW